MIGHDAEAGSRCRGRCCHGGAVDDLGRPAPGRRGSHALIQGSGSSWAANAVNQWVTDTQSKRAAGGLHGAGLGPGPQGLRQQHDRLRGQRHRLPGHDSATGDATTSRRRPYAYLPIVAGGTSFPYQIRVGGQLVRNLRLSGTTIAKIFTNKITNWDDPAITAGQQRPGAAQPADHPGGALRGSGSTYQFTAYLATEYPSIWTAGADRVLPAQRRPGGGERLRRRDELPDLAARPTARSGSTSTPTRWARTTRWPRC